MDESIVVSRFARIIASLKHALLHQDFEAGRLLIELEKEKDYGEWGTFDNFVDSELRITPRHAYRLLFAYRMREFFKEHDRLLPICESQVRPLAALDENRQRAK